MTHNPGAAELLSLSRPRPYFFRKGIAMKVATKRAVIRLQLDVKAKQELDAIADRRGMTQIQVLSRVVKWFSKQDEVIQASILNLLSTESLGAIAPRILEQLAAAGKNGGRHEV